jgi:uncharacterized repeat protein (TIGR02543 family)
MNKKKLIKIIFIGLLVLGTAAASLKTISILHNKQIAENKIAALAQKEQSAQTATAVLSQNSAPVKNIVTPLKTNKKIAQQNTDAANQDDTASDSTDLATPIPLPPPTTTNYTLFVTSLNGTVSSNLSGIACGSTCSAIFNSGTNVTLSETPASGYTFSGWSGACSGTGSCQVLMNENQSVTASYTVNNVNTNTGTTYTAAQVATHNTQSDCWLIISGKVYNVTSFIPNHPGGVNAIVSRCGTDATIAYTVEGNGGHAHSAYAQSLLPTYFIGNLSTGSTTPPLTTTTYTLSVNLSGTGSGTVSGGSINCGTICSATVNSGTSITLTETPASGSTFSSWSGACSGTGSCIVTMNSNQAVTANFTTSSSTGTTGGNASTYTLSVTSPNGTVTSNPSAISCGTTCSATLKSGTSIILSVIPASGFTFSGWSGACSGTATSCKLTMSSNQTVTANY